MKEYIFYLVIIGVGFLSLGIIAVLGYIRYKMAKHNANTWQEGNRQIMEIIYHFLKRYVFPFLFEMCRLIIKLIRWLIKKYNDWWKDKNISREVDNSLLLNDKEYLEIKQRLKGNPFEFPRIGTLYQDDLLKGILRFDILAVGLSSKYKDIENAMIREIVFSVVIDYYQETRGKPTKVYVTVASPIRVQIAIALSVYGNQLLQKELTYVSQGDNDFFINTLEEEIDIPEE